MHSPVAHRTAVREVWQECVTPHYGCGRCGGSARTPPPALRLRRGAGDWEAHAWGNVLAVPQGNVGIVVYCTSQVMFVDPSHPLL